MIMKKLVFVFLFIIPFMVFGQSMNIKWEDRDGREFSINTHTGNFKYSMVSGDQLEYNNGYSSYDTGEKGTIRKIGDVKIIWNNGYSSYDTGEKGTLRSVGDVKIVWNNGYSSYDTGEKGTLRSIGGLKVEYNNGYSSYDKGPKGTIRGTSESVY